MKRVIQGEEVDEARVDKWWREGERLVMTSIDSPPSGVAPRGALAAQVIPMRLAADEHAAVMARAERGGLNRSDAIRAALDTWAHFA
jgi:hypothetical protein